MTRSPDFKLRHVPIRWGALDRPHIDPRINRYQHVLGHVSYKEWCFEIQVADYAGHAFLVARFEDGGRDWGTRKWPLSPHMTESEIVQTALLCILVAEEHEAREKFLFRGKPVFGPHFDVDRLHDLCEEPDHLDVRS